MLGVLITLLFSAGAACFGHLLIRKLTPELDVAMRTGLSGLVGLGAIGTLTLFVGLAPGGLSTAGTWLVVLVVAASAALTARSLRYRPPIPLPQGAHALFLAGLAIALLFALVSVLAPSDTVEWDSLAYHLAVPKLWLEAGQIIPVSFIHHSNFPFAIDNLYIWGLAWGGQPGAKAFTLAFHVFGLFAVFGLARQVYGTLAGWWASLAWSTIPAVLWLSGTAYIDVQNGLYAGLGILLTALTLRDSDFRFACLAGIMLGLAAGSKYTGLQTIFAAGVVMLGFSLIRRQSTFKAILVTCGLALLIASPWYVKNVAWMGNPVYPFFYKQLRGKYWSDWQATIYSNEQQSFGVGRPAISAQNPEYTAGKIEPQRIGHAIFGLAYEPGRYINPGQTSGQGFPIGSLGFVVIATLALWMFSGRASPFESAVIATILMSFAMWFVLSEQSRYIIALAVPLSVLAGGAIKALKIGPLLAGAIIVQALYSFYLAKTFGGDPSRFDRQLQVATGRLSTDEYMHGTSFWEPAKVLNQTVGRGRVALYDEVFGFLLDVPYLWANPGHSNELGYESMQNGDDLVKSLSREGVTHVYVNLYPPGSNPQDPELQRWIATTGLGGRAQPYTAEEKAARMPDLNWRAKVLLGEAIASGHLRPIQAFPRSVIFELVEHPPAKI